MSCIIGDFCLCPPPPLAYIFAGALLRGLSGLSGNFKDIRKCFQGFVNVSYYIAADNGQIELPPLGTRSVALYIVYYLGVLYFIIILLPMAVSAII